jgi:membrane protein
MKEKGTHVAQREETRSQTWNRPARPAGDEGGGGAISYWQLLKETVREWTADEASQLAAALAYYTAVSIAPLVVLVVVIVGLFLGRQAAQGELMAQIQGAVGAQGAEFVSIALQNADQPSLASATGIFSFLVLLWGSTNVFSQLQNSLNKIWNVETKPGRGILGMFKDRLASFGLVLGIAFLLLVSLLLSAVLSALSSAGESWLPGADWLWRVVDFVVSLAVITLLFAAIYKVLPDVEIAWRDVWLGAAVTALLFTVGKFVLGLYLGNAGSTYGVVGSLVVFLLWVYYSAQILFLGAEFTEVYARHFGGGIQPSAGAVRAEQAPETSR